MHEVPGIDGRYRYTDVVPFTMFLCRFCFLTAFLFYLEFLELYLTGVTDVWHIFDGSMRYQTSHLLLHTEYQLQLLFACFARKYKTIYHGSSLP